MCSYERLFIYIIVIYFKIHNTIFGDHFHVFSILHQTDRGCPLSGIAIWYSVTHQSRHWYVPSLVRVNSAELWCFLIGLNKLLKLKTTVELPLIWNTMMLMWRHCDEIYLCHIIMSLLFKATVKQKQKHMAWGVFVSTLGTSKRVLMPWHQR